MKKKYDLSKHTELIARPYNLPLNSIVRLITGALPTISERTRKLFYRHLRHFPPQWSKTNGITETTVHDDYLERYRLVHYYYYSLN